MAGDVHCGSWLDVFFGLEVLDAERTGKCTIRRLETWRDMAAVVGKLRVWVPKGHAWREQMESRDAKPVSDTAPCMLIGRHPTPDSNRDKNTMYKLWEWQDCTWRRSKRSQKSVWRWVN